MPPRRAAQVVTVHDLDFLDHPERTQAEIRRDYRGPRAGARAARRRRRHGLAIHRGRDRTAARCRHGPYRDLPAGRTGVGTAAGARAERADPVHGDARAAKERRRAAGRLCGAARAEAGCPAAVARRRRDRGRGAVAAPIATPPLAGRVEHLGYVATERALRAVRARRRCSCCRRISRVRHAGARGDDGGVPVDRQQPRRAAGSGRATPAQIVEPDDVDGLRGGDAALPRRPGAARRPRPRAARARARLLLGRQRARAARMPRRAAARGERDAHDAGAAHDWRSTRASCSASRPASGAISASCCDAGGRGRTRPRGGSCSTRRNRCRSSTPFPPGRTSARSSPAADAAPGGSRRTCAARCAPIRPTFSFAGAYTAPLALGVPLAVTIHDVSFAAHPEWFRPREGARRRLLTRAGGARGRSGLHRLGVLARRDPPAALGRRAERVRVIPPGVTLRRPPATARASRWCSSSARSSIGAGCRADRRLRARDARRARTRGWSLPARTAAIRALDLAGARGGGGRRRAGRTSELRPEPSSTRCTRAPRSSCSCPNTKGSG